MDTVTDITAPCLRSFQLMVDGTLADFEEVVHPEAFNHEGKDEPPTE